MSALSRAHVLVLVDTAKEFDAAICYGAAQEQEAVLVPNTGPHRCSLTQKRTLNSYFQLSDFGQSFMATARATLSAKSAGPLRSNSDLRRTEDSSTRRFAEPTALYANMPLFTAAEIEAIADALGHTEHGLIGREIEYLVGACRMVDRGPTTKAKRLYNAFAESQNSKQNRTHILEFIRMAMAPARYAREPGRYEPMRANLNRALAFGGLVVDDAGKLSSVSRATTLPEAERRALDLRRDLEGRGVHADVLSFCRAELLADNYFHAVQEAVKSVAAKLRARTGLLEDGAELVDRTLTGKPPMLVVNPLVTPSERSEQTGFANLVRGTFGMFRNPTAHEARINWPMTKADTEDLLTLVSMIHRRLDAATMPPRV